MKKSTGVLAACAFATMMAQGVLADVAIGQKLYLKACKECHGNGTKGAAMRTQAGWDKEFAGDGLVAKHAKTPAAAYFNGAYSKHKQHLHDFLKEYGSDSGNVPSCS